MDKELLQNDEILKQLKIKFIQCGIFIKKNEPNEISEINVHTMTRSELIGMLLEKLEENEQLKEQLNLNTK